MRYDFGVMEQAWREAGYSKAQIKYFDKFYDREKFAAEYIKPGGKPWKCHEYQKESINWYGLRKAHRSGRSTGKTKDLEICALSLAMTQPHKETLIAAQREQHIEPLFERLIRIVEGSDLRQMLVKKPQRSPDYVMQFVNGHILWGRIGGPAGQNFQGMHVDNQLIEEGQEMTDKSWKELLPGLNDGGLR